MALNIFLRMEFIRLNGKWHGFLRDLILFGLCFDFCLNKLFLLFFVLLLIYLLWLTNQRFCSLSLFMLSIVIKMNIFGNSRGVIINVHTVNIFLHLKSLLMNIIGSFGIFSPLRTKSWTNVSHFLSYSKIFLK